jgi:UDP-N-acetylmuramoyl-L-alanyl-D-glutamate--2,6-diaminopimelate ligase
MQKKYFYSIDQKSDFQGTEFKTSLEGTTMNINGNRIQTSLIGRFNAYNILVAYAATTLLGISETDLISVIEKLTPPAGRLQFVKSNNGVYGIVDYAHTPDALQNILKTVNQVKPHDARIITVFGCGGDRDTTKRPQMGNIAAEFSDYIIVTSDNPRTENPEKIIDDIIQGIPESFTNYERITNRADAIKKAAEMAGNNDVIVVAGKGHETYQIFSDTTIHFSDLEELKKHFN